MAYKDFTQMTVWQKAFALLLLIYKTTKSFPSEEKFGLVSDMRRAANSVVHNISEGYGRFESRDKTRFYKISRGSCYEIISQVMVAFALGYIAEKIDEENLIKGYREVIAELDPLIKSIETKNLSNKHKIR
jgi:four helix bundle protein